ncbi:hypothetical protein HNR00_004789 [Methylorubrum rhodinum]|uniref:Uncharacterized protein n=1 Tax=Methylorubrum rhodinum TaxID=29428 RepID=A0A840ZSL1_9HYPH|nr:hypothetical protein [Methylorubrum rhodinum]MBB5760048.1 hypothetical protein [Methylorubrum rhodinum]
MTQAMPLCRHSTLPALPAPPGPTAVRLSHYVVTRRTAPRAANDNRRPRAVPAWPWAVAIAAAPMLTAALIVMQLI